MSVIVPARNEEACLGACLESLRHRAGVGSKSSWLTMPRPTGLARLPSRFRSARGRCRPAARVDRKEQRHGRRSERARGEWLLFTDADTVHVPGSLARAVAEAETARCRIALLFSRAGSSRILGKGGNAGHFRRTGGDIPALAGERPRSPAAAANGQYILITREAYDAIGGHGAVSDSLLEDVALAKAVKVSGRGIFFRFGGDAVRTRMYRSFAQLREGWTKNLALLFPSPARLALLRLTEFLLIAGGLAAALTATMRGHYKPATAAAILALAVYGFLLNRVRKAHFSWQANALSPAGLLLFAYLLLRSRLSHRRGSVRWKGRTYGSSTNHPGTDSVIIRQQRPAERSSVRY